MPEGTSLFRMEAAGSLTPALEGTPCSVRHPSRLLPTRKSQDKRTAGSKAGAPMSAARFTDRAQTALRLAQESSSELGHGYVGSEHLLLGLAREGHGVAARVLQSAGWSLNRFVQPLPVWVGVGAPAAAPPRDSRPAAKRSSSSLWPRLRVWDTDMWEPNICLWACSAKGKASLSVYLSAAMWTQTDVRRCPQRPRRRDAASLPQRGPLPRRSGVWQ